MYKEFITKIHPFMTAPRQLAFPERVCCYSTQQLIERFNRYNGIKRKLYYSIYRTNNQGMFHDILDENSPDGYEWRINIDTIPFDIDSDKGQHALETLRRVAKYCEEKNYKAFFCFSTGGFWAFIKTTEVSLNHPKLALGEAQRHLAQEMNLTIGQGDEYDLDSAIIGDTARITRAINSKDVGRGRFCIVLKRDEVLKMDYDEICELARQPRFEYYFYGEECFDLKPFDKAGTAFVNGGDSNTVTDDRMFAEYEQVAIEGVSENVDEFLPCVRSWLVVPHKDVFNARYYFAVYMAQTGRPPAVTDALAKEYFSKTKRTDSFVTNYNHFNKCKTIKKAYMPDKFFPNCSTLAEKGLCPGRCAMFSENNSPIYYQGETDDIE